MRIVRLHYNACVGRYPAQNLLNEFTFSLKSSQNCKALQCFDVKSKFSTNNFKKIRIPQFSETRFGSFVGLFLVYKQ